ncbi:MAG: proline racemase family protein [Microbacteriaceae bacterium]
MRWSRMLTAVGTHSGGEYARVVTGGIVDVPGETMFDKRNWFRDHGDHYRRRLLFEPVGGVLHAADVILPSNHPDAQFGYVILESTEYAVMSGSNTISVATVLLETGMVEMVEPVTELVLESPAGLITLTCECRDGKVVSVELVNQPAFVYHLDAPLEVPGIGTITVDVAWGGMAYVLARADDLGFAMTEDEAGELSRVGEIIKAAAVEQLSAVHPVHPDYAGISQTEIMGPVSRRDGGLHARNAVVVRPGRLDRSACGTGTSARLAVLHARGEIAVGEPLVHESVLGSQYTGTIVSTTEVGGVPAVVPSIAGQAWITDIAQLGIDPTDPFPEGYTLSDTWGPVPPPRFP